MRVDAIAQDLRQALDAASGGKLTELLMTCTLHKLEADLFVQTHLDGLPEGKMKLFLTGFQGDETAFLIEVPLEGPAQILGWNLTIYEAIEDARGHLTSAKANIVRAEAEKAQDGGKLDADGMLDLMAALRLSLNQT